MRADAPPDDVWLALCDLLAVLERRSSVIRPRHLEDTGRSLDAFHSQACPELATQSQVFDEVLDRSQERSLLRRRQPLEVRAETRQPGEGRHALPAALRGRPGYFAQRSDERLTGLKH